MVFGEARFLPRGTPTTVGPGPQEISLFASAASINFGFKVEVLSLNTVVLVAGLSWEKNMDEDEDEGWLKELLNGVEESVKEEFKRENRRELLRDAALLIAVVLLCVIAARLF
jgi:hypothetical protein